MFNRNLTYIKTTTNYYEKMTITCPNLTIYLTLTIVPDSHFIPFSYITGQLDSFSIKILFLLSLVSEKKNKILILPAQDQQPHLALTDICMPYTVVSSLHLALTHTNRFMKLLGSFQ